MTIMVVESYEDRLFVLVKWLENLYPGARVQACGDALLAVQYSLHHPVELVFAAAAMPRMDGLQLARGIHRWNPGARVYLVGRGQELRGLWGAEGISGCLETPCGPDDLWKLMEGTGNWGAGERWMG